MKRNYIYTLATAFAALALSSCLNEEVESTVENAAEEAIQLSASVNAPSITRATNDNIQPTSFDGSEEIRVECTRDNSTAYGSSEFGFVSSIYVTAAADAGVNALTLKSGETIQYWPAKGTVSFDAFYPSWVTHETAAFSVSIDQSDTGTATTAVVAEPVAPVDPNDEEAATAYATALAAYNTAETTRGYKGSDLMYATHITGQSKTNDVIGLSFHHALSKIIINLNPGVGMLQADIDECTVEIHAKKSTAWTANNFATLTSSSATGSVVKIKAGVGDTNAAIIVPQVIDGSSTAQDFITVTTAHTPLNEADALLHQKTYKLSTERTFEPGKVYTFTLTVNMDSIELQSATISNWTDGDNGHPTEGSIII